MAHRRSLPKPGRTNIHNNGQFPIPFDTNWKIPSTNLRKQEIQKRLITNVTAFSDREPKAELLEKVVPFKTRKVCTIWSSSIKTDPISYNPIELIWVEEKWKVAENRHQNWKCRQINIRNYWQWDTAFWKPFLLSLTSEVPVSCFAYFHLLISS